MNNLEGYSTSGHEYRMSVIDRSNSRRLKWMMNEAKKKSEIRNQEDMYRNQDSKTASIVEKDDKALGKAADSNSNSDRNFQKREMFNPSAVNKFANMKNNFK